MTNGREIDRPATYKIRIQGVIDSSWSDWFDGFDIAVRDNETVLVGRVIDQSALHGILAKINDLGLTLISVKRSTS